MTTRRLADKLAPLMERLAPDDVLRRQDALRAAIGDGGEVRAPALGLSLRQMQTWYLPGAVSVGANVEREIVWPQASTAHALAARCKITPAGSELTVALVVDGAQAAAVTIRPGVTAGVSPLSRLAIPAGAVVTLSILSAGTTTPAQSVSVTLTYSPA